MAIIIPSKNIYEINNQKVVDNEVDNIEVTAKNVTESKEYDVVVHREEFSNETYDGDFLENNNYVHLETDVQQTSITTHIAFSHVSIRRKYMDVEILINKSFNNKRILKIKSGTDNEGNADIKYQLQGIVAKGTAKDYVTLTAERLSSVQDVEYGYNYVENAGEIPEYEREEPYTLPKTITQHEEALDSSYETYPCDATLSYFDEGNVGQPIIEETEDTIKLSLKCLVGAQIYKLGVSNWPWIIPQKYGSINGDIGDYDGAVNANTDVLISGEYEVYNVSGVEFNIYGDTYGINLEDKNLKFGDGKHVYSFNGNELIQTSNKILDSRYGLVVENELSTDDNVYSYYRYSHSIDSNDLEIGDILYKEDEKAIVTEVNGTVCLKVIKNGVFASMSGTLATYTVTRETEQVKKTYKDIIREWKNGKEIVTIRCSIDDYFDELGNKAIDVNSNKLTISISDELIPYVMGADRKDRPMSLYNDRTTPKKFLVIGKRIISEGQITQEIKAQEIIKT